MIDVSILIPCCNAERFIEQAVESALSQTIPGKEVIVIDDGSKDGSLARILRFGSSIRVESGPNRGGNRTRNRLLALARGRWVQYLDADDYLLPEKIEQQLSDASPDAEVLFGAVTVEESLAGGEARREVLEIPDQPDVWQLLIRWHLPQTGGSLWRRDTLRAAGGWKNDQPVCQEHELYLRLLAAGAAFERTSGGAVYRIWSNGTVCRRNPLATLQMKMKIVHRAETILRERQQLDDERKRCLAHARLETARVAYPLDPEFAFRLSREAEQAAPGFVPPYSDAFPPLYRLTYRLLGFRTAERLAGLKRRLAGSRHLHDSR
jgi:glycosyltransferase involved in cell wall biosynthesis